MADEPLSAGQKAPPPQNNGEEEGPAISPVELAVFAGRSAKRHVRLCVLVGLVIASLGSVVVMAIPSVYESTCKLHVTLNTALTAYLASGRREDPYSVLKGVNEAVVNRDNIMAMVREAKLADGWDATRTWPLHLKDEVFTAVFGPLAQQEKERALAELLAQSLAVIVEDGTSIRFRTQWRDAEDARRLTDLAMENFVEGRIAEESAAISRAIQLLEEEMKRANESIEPAIKQVEAAMDKTREAPGGSAAKPRSGSSRPRAPVASASPGPVSGTGDIGAKLDDLRRAEREIAEPWQRHTAELKFRLSELQATYGPEHPAVLQQEAKIRASQEVPPELARLRSEETQLLSSLNLASANGSSTSPSLGSLGTSYASADRSNAMGSALRAILDRDTDDPEVQAARLRLTNALQKVTELNMRLDTARIDLAAVQASAKSRYAVVEAAEVPRKPFKPKRAVLFAAVVAAAALLGFLAGAVRELLTGQLLEAWQVRRLGVDVLAEVELRERTGR